MWTTNGARAVFPGRRIGALREGYEASFLVLEGNPLANFDAVTRIRLRFKDGRPLRLGL
jgi:imidazolonepropionase-like amidohydrolase